MKRTVTAVLCGIVFLFVSSAWAASPIRVMLLDGQQSRSHPWEPTSPVLVQMLEQAGPFEVEQVTSPPVDGADLVRGSDATYAETLATAASVVRIMAMGRICAPNMSFGLVPRTPCL